MANKALSLPSADRRRRKPVEATALLTLRPLSDSELQRVSRVLAAEGIDGLHAARIRLTARDAATVGDGDTGPVAATLIREPSFEPAEPDAALTTAIAAARARGTALQEEWLADPDMLNTAGMAERLGMSEEGVRLKRRRHEILGLEFAKRGIRYPGWQVLPDRQLLPALPDLFRVLGDDPWRLFRFLQQHHRELGGQRALEALRRGRVDAVLAAAENAASGAFA